MADIFVWSGAGGGNDGTQWEDAFTTIARDYGPLIGVGDFVYVRDSHNESDALAKTITGSSGEGTEDPVRILCVVGNDTGTTPGNLSTGASVATTGNNNLEIDEKIWIYGIDFISGNSILLGDSALDQDIYLEQCRLELTTDNANDEIKLLSSGTAAMKATLIDTDVAFINAGQGFSPNHGHFLWDGGTLEFNVNNLFELLEGRNSTLEIRNVDLSICSNNLVYAAGIDVATKVLFNRCTLHADVSLVNGTIDVPGADVKAHNCDDGTDGDPAVNKSDIPLFQSYHGQVFLDTARYRTGGATDAVRSNPYSWNMTTENGSSVIELYEPLESPPIAGWTDGDASTAHTYRIYFASGATLEDDEIWFDLTLPNETDTSSLGQRETLRIAPLDTPASTNRPTDGSSTWTGSNVGTKQYMEITATPDKPGPITARVYFAHPYTDDDNGRVSIDPKVYIDP